MLGGLRIPSPVGLDGHSDADVLLHAICDALLGAIAAGDIGSHFPPMTKKYKGISSLVLLKRVGRVLKEAGYEPDNIDATVVLESPQISPYVPRMRRKIASALGLRADQVSVKATTNEGLGDIGHRLGCAAYAVASVRQLQVGK